ncbi:hypothetical protein [Rhodohalobacter barkolensis]|uniref:Uncharacterized protein n=1 Tax=Rhodohalobacter barkolensis TaxID=2053187 RepID=A0A2N0VLL5_9BACT|nr:hypothetical protein [Rhodohalobacter barkolensis]PKD45093.1 hypothetical protein CWD77_06470 [Rhodohalobacter barkolensis]
MSFFNTARSSPKAISYAVRLKTMSHIASEYVALRMNAQLRRYFFFPRLPRVETRGYRQFAPMELAF